MDGIREDIIIRFFNDEFQEALLLFELNQNKFVRIEEDYRLSTAIIKSYYYCGNYKSCYNYLRKRIEILNKSAITTSTDSDEYNSLILLRVEIFRNISMKKMEIKALEILIKTKTTNDILFNNYHQAELSKYLRKITFRINVLFGALLFLFVILNHFLRFATGPFYILFLLLFAFVLLLSNKIPKRIFTLEQKLVSLLIFNLTKFPKRL